MYGLLSSVLYYSDPKVENGGWEIKTVEHFIVDVELRFSEILNLVLKLVLSRVQNGFKRYIGLLNCWLLNTVC